MAASEQQNDEALCLAYTQQGDNYKTGHKNIHCIVAANLGIGSAQYAVGMGYGFEGDHALEEKYYRLAADNRVVAAYLALGHVLAEKAPYEAIYWYQRSVCANGKHDGYAAILISKIFAALGNEGQATYWREVCKNSQYKYCN